MSADTAYGYFSESNQNADETLQQVWSSQEGIIQGMALKLGGAVQHSSNFTRFVWINNRLVRKVPLAGSAHFETIGFVDVHCVTF